MDGEFGDMILESFKHMQISGLPAGPECFKTPTTNIRSVVEHQCDALDAEGRELKTHGEELCGEDRHQYIRSQKPQERGEIFLEDEMDVCIEEAPKPEAQDLTSYPRDS